MVYSFEFPPLEQSSNPVRGWLVTPMTFMPLLQKWTCLTWKVDIVIDGGSQMVKTFIDFVLCLPA